MADDQLAQLFPGADHPEMPADALISIPDRWAPKRPPVISPESLIICKPAAFKVHGLDLPFTLASVVGPMGPAGGNIDEQLVVQWWVPPICKLSTRQGRRTNAVDIFGAWRSSGTLTLNEAAEVEMPSVLVHRSNVLMGPIELNDSKLMFSDLDKLIDQHNIDITGLNFSHTSNGSAFRAYRLLTH